MNDFPSSIGIREEPRDDNASIDSDQQDIYAENDNPGQIVTFAPKEEFRLGYFDVTCLVINRMIGTGIFMSPQRVMQGTQSTGASLLFWFVGIVYCLCGMHVYIEYGLNVPRYVIDGVEQSVPRSGGDLNYLQYVYRKPAYRKNTILLSTCLFGVAFIVLGNMAGNSINFGTRVMEAAGREPGNGPVRGIAIAVATFTCFIHAFSRRGGIWLNNGLAIIKIMLLLTIIITAIVVGAGGLPKTENVITENTAPSKSFGTGSSDANGYAQAFLAIIFCFSGFEQPNYVLGEISRPKKKFPISMGLGVGIVVTLYMAVNICYMVVVPRDEQITYNVASRFFELTFGKLGGNAETGNRIFHAFLAVSSMGNIIVMTYTAARVKQEIMKEGVFPGAKFFAQNKDMSLGRLLRWFQRKGWLSSITRLKWFSPAQHTEKTPVGALVLHFVSCVILIFATYTMKPLEAYTLLTTLSAYVINACVGTFLGLGILILRFRGPPPTASGDEDQDQTHAPASWRDLTGKRIKPIVSVVAATIYMLGGLYPVIASWVPPSAAYLNVIQSKTNWYVVPVVSWCIIAAGVLWFLGFVVAARNIDKKHHRVFVVEKKPEFEPAGGSSKGSEGRGGDQHSEGLVLVHETVYLSWVGRETLRSRRQPAFDDVRQGEGEMRGTGNLSPFAGTDFDGYFQGQNQQTAGGSYRY